MLMSPAPVTKRGRRASGFEAEFLRTEDLLLGQVFGGGVGMFEALGHLLFGQPQVIAAVEIDRRRRQVHQAPRRVA